MKTFTFFIITLMLTACSGSLNNKNTISNNQFQMLNNKSVTVFEGILPCADCNGIKTTLTLYQNKSTNLNTYKLHEIYLGQNSSKTFDTYGKWMALKGTQEDPTAVVYQLSVQNEDPEDPDVINYLLVNNNTLKMIDDEMNAFESKDNYTLIRKPI